MVFGLIPARAGNTTGASRGSLGKRAHPRSRGEHRGSERLVARLLGSSPLARGTRAGRDVMIYSRGLIPARAGNTGITKAIGDGVGAHPRSRGEHQEPTPSKCSSTGSSPLARGTLLGSRSRSLCRGLIPARAGNTFQRCPRAPGCRAHPRSRGEHTC